MRLRALALACLFAGFASSAHAQPAQSQPLATGAIGSRKAALEQEASDLRWIIDQIENQNGVVVPVGMGLWMGPKDQFDDIVAIMILTGRLPAERAPEFVRQTIRNTKAMLPEFKTDLARVEGELGRVIQEQRDALQTAPPTSPSALSDFAGAEAHGEWSVGCPSDALDPTDASSIARSGTFSFRFASSGSPLVIRGTLFAGSAEWPSSGYLYADGTASGTAAPPDRSAWVSLQGSFVREGGGTRGSGIITIVPAGAGAPCSGEWKTY